MPVPKDDMKFEQPKVDVPENWSGPYLWNLAKQESPNRDPLYFAIFTVFLMCYFGMLHIVFHQIFIKHNEKYKSMKETDRHLYKSYLVSIFHSIGCVIFSTLAMWYVCPGEETVFNSDHCVNTVRHIHIWSLLHTCGYFLSDFLVIVYLIKGNTTLDKQTLWHHALGALVFYETLIFMDFCVVFGTMLLFIEVSTIFLAVRYFLYTHDMSSSLWYYLNVVFMFVSFLVCRLYFTIYISFIKGLPYIYDKAEWDKLSVIQVLVTAQMACIVLASLVLNIYWFWLMVKMIVRVAGRALFPPREKEESIELVKADALKQRGSENEVYYGSSEEHGKGPEPMSPRKDKIDELGGFEV